MRIKVYETKEDWVKGFGFICDGMGSLSNAYCVVIEDSNHEIEGFIGKNGRVYCKSHFSDDDLDKLFRCTRKIVRFITDTERPLTKRVYAAKSSGNYSINGEIIPHSEKVCVVLAEMFNLVSPNVVVISFSPAAKKVYLGKVYEKVSSDEIYLEILSKNDFKEF